MIEFIRPGFFLNFQRFKMLFMDIIQNGLKPKADKFDKSAMARRSYILFNQLENIVHVSVCYFIFEFLFFNS